MNNVTLLGRLTRDPELRYLQGGQDRAVARFTLAVDKQISREKKNEMESKGQPTADFIQIVVWGRLAENVTRYTGKGKRVAVNGRIQTGSYVDKDGKTVYTTDVVASNVEFIDWKDSSTSTYEQGFDQTRQGNQNQGFDDFQYGADFDPTADDGRIPF